MKSRVYLLLFLLLPALSANAQVEKAKNILAQVSKKYKAYSSIQANFKLEEESPKVSGQAGYNKQLYSGNMTLKGDKFKIELGDHAIHYNGKKVYIYDKANNQITVDYFHPESLPVNPTQIFTMYNENFISVLNGETNLNGKQAYIIELAPTDKDLSFFKVKLLVDKKTYEILQSTIYQKNGTRYIVTVSELKTNQAISDTTFELDRTKYPKVIWEDLTK